MNAARLWRTDTRCERGDPLGAPDRLREAIRRAAWAEWIASSLSLLAMTAKSVTGPEIIRL